MDDDGGGDYTTIQAAINAAVANDTILINGGADRIHTEQGIGIGKSVTILGDTGGPQVIVQAAPTPGTATDRVFSVGGSSVRFENLTIRHGFRNEGIEGGGFGDGGAIFSRDTNLTVTNCTIFGNSAVGQGGGIYLFGHISDGTTVKLTIENTVFSQNSAESGGGLYILSGTTRIANTTFSQNTASSSGGGIEAILASSNPEAVVIDGSMFSQNTAEFGGGLSVGDSNVAVRSSTFADNIGHQRGGAIYNGTGPLTLTTSSLTGNSSTLGGAIYSETTEEILRNNLTVSDSTISHNSASMNGGGIHIESGRLELANSTISQNSAQDNGGGIFVFQSGGLQITNSTVTGNRADIDDNGGVGGGLVLINASIAKMTSTIVAGNFQGSGNTASDILGVLNATNTNNLVGDPNTAGGLRHGTNRNIVGDGSGNAIDISSVLDTTLRDNGGPTRTHMLVMGSPAINAGLNPQSFPFDQRGPGFARTLNGQTDIGAVESPFGSTQDIPALALGTGGETLAQVRVYNSALDEIFRLFPYQGFTGSVRVALADVTGDEAPDIITAAGTGGGPHIKVFDGITGQTVRSFFAYNPSFNGGVYVAAADLNNDGRADIITGAGETGGPHVRAFSGLDGSLLFDFFAYNPNFTGGVRVASGDITGDQRPDIITGAGPGGGSHVRVFDGTNPLLAAQGINIAGPLGSFFAYEATYTGGVFVGANNTTTLNGPLIITGSGLRTDGPAVGLFSRTEPAQYFQLPLYSEARVAMLDFNRDGINDYLAATGPRANGHVQLYSGDDRGTQLPFGPLLVGFHPFGELYRGGIFVAGSI